MCDALVSSAGSNAAPLPQTTAQLPDDVDEFLDFQALSTLLADRDSSFLEDLSWFVDDVLRVEKEMRATWAQAVERWRSVISFLVDKGRCICANS